MSKKSVAQQDADQTQATYTGGILRVQLARSPEATPKKIPVKS